VDECKPLVDGDECAAPAGAADVVVSPTRVVCVAPPRSTTTIGASPLASVAVTVGGGGGNSDGDGGFTAGACTRSLFSST